MLEGMQGVSTYASDVDRAFFVVNSITLFLFAVTIGSMLFFVYKYSAKRNPPQNAQNIEHYTPIEIAWTVIPTILLGIIFYYGLDSLRMQRTMPNDDNAIQINVIAKRWSWSFEYENGKKSSELVVPINKNVKLSMTAPLNDVLHSFYVPAFRTKEDIIPGQITYLWFNATTKGKFDIQCAEYCGTRHSYMLSFVKVVDEEEYNNWLNPKVTQTKDSTPNGLDLITQNGCLGCHSLDGSKIVGPTFKNIYNRKVKINVDGNLKDMISNDQYLKNAILKPDLEVVDGYYPGVMPPFEFVLKEKEVEAIIQYLKTVK